MTTVIKIEGESPYSLPHVDHISAIAHGENIDLTLYVALPGHADLGPVDTYRIHRIMAARVTTA